MEFVVVFLCTNPVAWCWFRILVAAKKHRFAILSRIGRSFMLRRASLNLYILGLLAGNEVQNSLRRQSSANAT